MKYLTFIFILISQSLTAQTLKLPQRKADALTGSAFAKSISDSSLTLEQREKIIYKEIKNGNVPNFLRKLTKVTHSNEWDLGDDKISVSYYVLPDYFCIGSDEDFFYVPMTPILAQKVADLTKCSLPTKRMVNKIYENATIKLAPKPIPPTKAMTTVPVFIAHNQIIKTLLKDFDAQRKNSELIAGHKKDIIISNKIYGEKSARVVIYGWHKLDGKPIQPMYNKHTNTWADYSHGVRLVQQNVWINGKKTKIAKVLKNEKLSILLSDEERIEKPFYPATKY
ncbi:MAG: hypothetical protein V4546_06310 [Bacteroidota bacterium]